ncbi:hypothetical protein FGG08_002417 [Glutinoglossum americanum]|uniref:Phosphatidylserine decarboxylase proenzyme 1, mitochondrial n=1 Tax=Glutinoglossum americanum TaxID=1670608 RepID=A0A9P8IBP1_9PEZI|nr:hypothetical protein FGG08_002417 [Glutinoglossum americanum]
MALRVTASSFRPYSISLSPRQAPPHIRTTRKYLVYSRNFSSSARRYEQGQKQRHRESFWKRLRFALRNTRIEWYPIPVGLGIGFLGFAQLYRVRQRKAREEEERRLDRYGEDGRPTKRQKIRPSGPWHIQVMSTLPLKALSRLWGRFNELEIPYYLRVPGFRLYSWIFGVNLSEVSEPDLHAYPNLASFFYRTLKPGVRPVDPDPLTLISPADGRILQFGTIEHGEVEQVKGVTYSVDALLGSQKHGATPGPLAISTIFKPSEQSQSPARVSNEDGIKSDEEFAIVNGISYTLPDLLSGQPQSEPLQNPSTDASTAPKPASEAEVRADLALGDTSLPWYARLTSNNNSMLCYAVIYLAPGDYHRFHSPTSWVVEKRRHFAGELYSVSPYLQRKLPGLFTLNERVVLLGRWRWGFFSYTPVGATNVGSIKINFDRELRTNSLTTDTAADRAAEEAANRGEPYSGFAEATYEGASRVLGGYALRKGEEMGGFQLGSTIVLVFEVPRGIQKSSEEGWWGVEKKGGWKWSVENGQRVRMGQPLGRVEG